MTSSLKTGRSMAASGAAKPNAIKAEPSKYNGTNDWVSSREQLALALASRFGAAYQATLKALYRTEIPSEAKRMDLIALASKLGGDALAAETAHILNTLSDRRELEAIDYRMDMYLAPLNHLKGAERSNTRMNPEEVTPVIVNWILEVSRLERAAEMLVDGLDPGSGQKLEQGPDYRAASERLFSAYRVVSDRLGVEISKGAMGEERVLAGIAEDLLWRATGYLKQEAQRAEATTEDLKGFIHAGNCWRTAAQYVVLLKMNPEREAAEPVFPDIRGSAGKREDKKDKSQPEAAIMLYIRAMNAYLNAREWGEAKKTIDRIESLERDVLGKPAEDRHYEANMRLLEQRQREFESTFGDLKIARVD